MHTHIWQQRIFLHTRYYHIFISKDKFLLILSFIFANVWLTPDSIDSILGIYWVNEKDEVSSLISSQVVHIIKMDSVSILELWASWEWTWSHPQRRMRASWQINTLIQVSWLMSVSPALSSLRQEDWLP